MHEKIGIHKKHARHHIYIANLDLVYTRLNMACSQLHLDRNLSNNAFESWRLAGGPSPVKEVLDLPGSVSRHEPESYDYLSARVAALRNHLHESNGKLWAFVRTAEGDMSLCCFSARGNAYALTDMLGLQSSSAMRLSAPGAMDCSLAAIQQPGLPQQLLVSSGRGELALVSTADTGTAVSAPVQPLPQAQPFILEAGYRVSAGNDVRCILWSIQPRSGAQPAHCTVHVVTLRCPPGPGAHLEVVAAELVARTCVPPQAVLANAGADSFALAASPVQAPVAMGGAGAPAAGAADSAADMEEDTVSPRTLQQAVVRLAQFTSEGPPPGAAPLDSGRNADIFADNDPGDDEASLASEPDIAILTFERRLVAPATLSQGEVQETSTLGHNPSSAAVAVSSAQAQPGSRAASGEPGSESGSGSGFTEVARLACAPHRLLAARCGGARALLGLIDDVDAAVVEVRLGGLPKGASQVSAAVHGAAAVAEHVTSVPALAYVAAGKVQRKAVLLGEPGAAVAAAIVEGARLAFVYQATPTGQPYGAQQVLDLVLDEGDAVVGAALVGVAKSKQRLVVLSKRKLIWYVLT